MKKIELEIVEFVLFVNTPYFLLVIFRLEMYVVDRSNPGVL
jgi:hypothetical protein